MKDFFKRLNKRTLIREIVVIAVTYASLFALSDLGLRLDPGVLAGDNAWRYVYVVPATLWLLFLLVRGMNEWVLGRKSPNPEWMKPDEEG